MYICFTRCHVEALSSLLIESRFLCKHKGAPGDSIIQLLCHCSSSMSSAPPILKIQCLHVWQPTSCIFDMEIETKDEQGNDTTVNLLRRRIHAGPSIPAGLPLYQISLYCVSIDLDDRESLPKAISENIKRQNIMDQHQTITEHFPEQPNARRLHVLVDYVGRGESYCPLTYPGMIHGLLPCTM